MKLREFTYIKSDKLIEKTDIESTRKLLIFNEDEKSIQGIDLTLLTDDEVMDLLSIQIEFEEKTKPYLKAFRKFLKEHIVEEKKK